MKKYVLLAVITALVICGCLKRVGKSDVTQVTGNEEVAKEYDCGKYVDPTSRSDFKISNIYYRDGVAFKDNQAIYIDADKMTIGEMFISKMEANNNLSDIVENGELDFLAPNTMCVQSTYKKDRYHSVSKTEKIYCMKIADYKLYINEKEGAGNWEPVTMRFLSDKLKYEHSVDTYPCLSLEIKTKWFHGKYELRCSPETNPKPDPELAPPGEN